MKSAVFMVAFIASFVRAEYFQPISLTLNTTQDKIDFIKGFTAGMALASIPNFLNSNCHLAAWETPRDLFEIATL